ncbi:MAG: D-2-hydroxyacid dehydrogenase [Oscillospiraceae bacterium]|nr:D-2-hydroxyacid dehydrogenase [Oscillospiraceae bacterium]
MKIVILDGHAVNPGDLSWDFLNKYGEVTVYERTKLDEVAKRIGDAEIVLTNKSPINEEILSACPNIKLVCVLATGYNVVDCEATKKRGIPVCNVPDYGTAAVAQFTFALLLDLCHKVAHHAQTVRDGKWCESPDFCYWETPQMELAGKTLGIIGFGRIGRAVGRIANAFGMKVIAYNRSQCEEGKAIGSYVNLEELLASSDIISLHCPLTPENTAMINAQTIAKMKDGAILINTARGPLIDESALAAALESGKLRGAACDVISAEPMTENNPLKTAPNCIVTPHMAWAPIESRKRIQECTDRSIQAFLAGSPINTVNM